MSRPRITALINTYNYGHFIEETIASVLAQDVPASEMEVLVVDDGSTDDTRARVAGFGNRVRYLYKENGGQASALNAGFAAARGEIIAMLDGDDLWLPGKVRRVLEEFDAHPSAGMVYHPYQWWYVEEGRQVNDSEFPNVSGDVPISRVKLLTYGDVGTCGMAVRRSALEKLLPVPEGLKILADSYLAYLIIFVAPVAAVNQCLTRVRVHGGNSFNFAAGDRARGERRLQCWSLAIEEIRAWLERNGYDTSRLDLRAYLKRYELVREELRFALDRPGRVEFFRFLRAHRLLYGPLWTPGYRAFRSLLAYAGFALGYSGFETLRTKYGRSYAIRARKSLIPAQ